MANIFPAGKFFAFAAIATLMFGPLPASAAPDEDFAAFIFSEARSVCERDGGALWHKSLCGPILLVDPSDRAIVASEADRDGALKRTGSVFTGTLPESVVVASTPTEWSGTRWTQILAPVTYETMNRRVLLAHELFHRIQPGLGLTRPEATNRQLDTLEGRYLLQLEWRALARALTAVASTDRRAAIADALLFRQARYRQFPKAAGEEASLEINEGIAEYTGVKLGLATPTERVAYAVYDLSRFVESPSFVRSFAYATGPAYGLLLDQVDPLWRDKLNAGKRLDELLAGALKKQLPPLTKVTARARRYDDGALRATEELREKDRLSRLADFQSRLLDGPVLVLPLAHSNFRFNPQTLIPLDDETTIYPTIGLVDDWGSLEVEQGGALVQQAAHRATVSIKGIKPSRLDADGWHLNLNPGWTVTQGVRAGDLAVTCSSGCAR